jgi:hypothetical protein
VILSNLAGHSSRTFPVLNQHHARQVFGSIAISWRPRVPAAADAKSGSRLAKRLYQLFAACLNDQDEFLTRRVIAPADPHR